MRAWSAPQEVSPDGNAGTSIRVLVVEDNPADARLVLEILAEQPGFRAAAVGRLREALVRLAAEPWDAVLLDLILPDARGEEVLTAVTAAAPDVAVVVLSGVDDGLALARRAVAVGAQDFLPKLAVDAASLRRSLVTAIERCRLLRALERRERQLEEAQRLARLGDFRWQPGEAGVDLSRQLQGMLGLPSPQVGLRTLLRRTAPADRRRLATALRSVLREREHAGLTLRLRTAAGTLGDFHLELRRSGPPGGSNTAIWGICQDIGDQLALARMKDEFVSIVSHELRTPLTCVLGAISALRGLFADRLPERGRELLETAHRNGARLAAMVDDLLDLQRMANGTLKVEPKPVDYARLVTEVVAEHRPSAGKRRVRLEIEPLRGRLFGRSDPLRFAQILGNLVGNAIKFSPTGGTVKLTLEEAGPFVRVTVADSGPGIPEDLLPRIFERFVQLDVSDRRARAGIGLGLAIARELAERLGGTIRVASRPGQGSRFTLELPRFAGVSNSCPVVAEDADVRDPERASALP